MCVQKATKSKIRDGFNMIGSVSKVNIPAKVSGKKCFHFIL